MSHSRREFLKSVVGSPALLSLSSFAPTFLHHAAMAAATQPGDAGNVLVVLQLSGGNDGLNTVVPYADDAYGRSRTTLRLTEREVHKIDARLGFHPEIGAMNRLYQEGLLSVVQGVGYPKSDRDHDGAMRNWHTARPGDAGCQTGWLGRMADQVASSDGHAPSAAFVGPIARPYALNARSSVLPSIRSADEWSFSDSDSDAGREEIAQAIRRREDADANPLLEHARRGTLEAHASAAKVESVLRGAGTGPYPDLTLAGQLKTVAQLIRADLGIRVFFTELGGGGIGGFDNHAGQRDNHAALLRQMSESLAAFADDLNQAGLLDRVVLMTFSEFGRTLTENGRRGTGHGAAAPVFLIGSRVKGGLIGDHPSLTDLDQDAPKPHTDFRRLYASMLEGWLGIDSSPIIGSEFPPLDLFA